MHILKKAASFVLLSMIVAAIPAQAARLKPFVLGNDITGDKQVVAEQVKAKLTSNGFSVVGSYAPYGNAIVICASHPALTAAAARTRNGGFGVAQRVAVTELEGKIQVAYMNPLYLGTAYGMGNLQAVTTALEQALGRAKTFGAEGVEEEDLKPGNYHYAMMMPYFEDVDLLNKHKDYQTALSVVEANLAAGKGGTSKVYRIDLPGREVSVFGVAIPRGDGLNAGDKDTDKEVLDIIDYKSPRSTAYLPYELMVTGGKVIALAGRYRIAVHFPDTKMVGEHGFTKIMSAPGGIKTALEKVAGYKRDDTLQEIAGD